MRNKAATSWLVVLITTLFNVTMAVADERAQKIVDIMERSNAIWAVENLIEEIELEQVKARIVDQDGVLSESERALYLKNFNQAAMLESIRTSLEQNLSLDETNVLLEFFKEPLIVKMLELDRQAESANEAYARKAFLRTLRDKPPSRERITLIHDLVDASLDIEQQVYLNALITYEKNKVPLEYFNKYGEEEAQKLEYYIEKYKTNMSDSMRPDASLVFMYRFREFTDDQIKTLIGLLKDQRRLHYHALFADAIGKELSDSLRAAIKAILDARNRPSS